MKWISVEDRLPKERQAIVYRLKNPPWTTRHFILPDLSKEQNDYRYVVGWLEHGKENPGRIITCNDKDGNNLRPYAWHTLGSSFHFGQEVSHWYPLTKLEGE